MSKLFTRIAILIFIFNRLNKTNPTLFSTLYLFFCNININFDIQMLNNDLVFFSILFVIKNAILNPDSILNIKSATLQNWAAKFKSRS